MLAHNTKLIKLFNNAVKVGKRDGGIVRFDNRRKETRLFREELFKSLVKNNGSETVLHTTRG